MPRPPRKKVALGAPELSAKTRQPLADKSINLTPRKPSKTVEKPPTTATDDVEVLVRSSLQDDAENAVTSKPTRSVNATPARTRRASSRPAQPGSAVRAPATNQTSRFNSILGSARPDRFAPSSAVKATPSFISTFKRRPRQNSILSMVQNGELEAQDDDLDDTTMFSLGGHSSPLNPPNEQHQAIESPPQSSLSAKRKRDSLDDPEPEDSTPPEVTVLEEAVLEQEAEAPARTTRRTRSSAAMAAAAAATSTTVTSDPSSNPKASRKSQPGTSKRVSPVERPPTQSPESTPPSSPAPRKRAATKQTKPRQKALTTAELQAYLPRRRQRRSRRKRQEEFDEIRDIEGSDSESSVLSEPSSSDESSDELAGRGRARKRANGSDWALTTAKDKGTYGRRSAGGRTSAKGQRDKSTGVGDTSLIADASKELQDAAAKFKEIDEWELSFESQDRPTEESSPWR